MAGEAVKLLQVAVRYARCGREAIWCDSLDADSQDGAGDASSVLRSFSAAVGRCGGGVRLLVVPARAGGRQCELAPVAGQSLLEFLERSCREDHGVFQLRAAFEAPSREGFVQVPVAFPGFVPTSLFPVMGAGSSVEAPIFIEQFELATSDDVAALKRMVEVRTQLPTSRTVLLIGGMRLQDDLSMGSVSAAVESVGAPVQLHLAMAGVCAFLRREGQGHREPSGPCTLTLMLPASVQGSRMRPMAFDPADRLCDLRWSVQAVSGLPPTVMQFSVTAPSQRPLAAARDTQTLESLGLVDGCVLKVERVVSDSSLQGDAFDMPMDTPTTGSAATLYERTAEKLGMADPTRLTLFAGNVAISRNSDLSCAALADGVVLSAYVSWSLQLSVSALARWPAAATASALAASSSSSAPSAAAGGSGDSANLTGMPSTVACLSSDTVAEVRERAIGSAASRIDAAARLRGAHAFAVDRSVWASGGAECRSLAALARLLGHFTPCRDGARLSRLGLADGGGHFVFVPDQVLLVEVEVFVAGETQGVRKLRAPSVAKLTALTALLMRNLQEHPLPECQLAEQTSCTWALPTVQEVAASPHKDKSAAPEKDACTAAAVSTPTPAPRGRRRSFGGGETVAEKRRRLCPPNGLPDAEFVGDLHAQHPAGNNELPAHYLCPISYDVMRDPVVVVGSGNTYDRKSIEQHFQHKHTDPLSNVELRRVADRRLVPNNALRSQIDEAERSQVDLRLAAHLGEVRRPGDASVAAYLGGWCASLLRGSV